MPKKTQAKQEACEMHEHKCGCKGALAVLILVLIWVSTALWSKVVITIAAALILLGSMMPKMCCHNVSKRK